MRKIKSYARIIGKSLSLSRKVLLENVLPDYQIDLSKISTLQNLHVEIGFGDGQHLLDLALSNPHQNFLGIEVYLNGVCNLLKACGTKRPQNLFIYPGDADLILELVPDNFICAFYILFPDPWPKMRQQKRRFINRQRLELIISKLAPSGSFKFVTDVEDYSAQVLDLIKGFNLDKVLVQPINSSPDNFTTQTKYHQKAITLKKKIHIVDFIKK